MSYPLERYAFFYLECSRAPEGVAATVQRLEWFLDQPTEAIRWALVNIGTAAAEHHHQDMMPSTDSGDYHWHDYESGDNRRVHLYLRDDHPWWQGPIAARVARRNKCTPEEWRTKNQLAYEYNGRPDRILLPGSPPSGFIALGDL